MAAQDNMELACAFIQKTAIEKAIPEIDKRLMTEYELRKLARNEGRRYCDPQVLTYQAERMPEQIRLKVGGVTPQQMTVYEEFARNIPGFLPLSDRDAAAMFIPKPVTVSASPPAATGLPMVPTHRHIQSSYGFQKSLFALQQDVQPSVAQFPTAGQTQLVPILIFSLLFKH